MIIFVVHSWSDMVAYQYFDWQKKKIVASGTVARVGLEGGELRHKIPGREEVLRSVECADHLSALRLILDAAGSMAGGIPAAAIAAVAHRVAHGGERFTHSVLIDDGVLAGVREVAHLAPLHNGANIAGIEAALTLLPDRPQAAIFDTAFHHSIPKAASLYALPYEWYEKYGIRRYGFHGPSHLYAARRGSVLLGRPLQDCRLITLHLGRGNSLCAVRGGQSVDTSMGLTPLEGVVMETRCGDIDPGIPIFMMQQEHFSSREVAILLNQKSGLLGVTGHASYGEVLAGAERGEERCRLAREMESYRLRKYVGAYAAALGGLDALVFTAEVGETDWRQREAVLAGLKYLGLQLDSERNRLAVGGREAEISAAGSPVRIFVVPSDEALVFAEETVALLGEASCPESYYSSDEEKIPLAEEEVR